MIFELVQVENLVVNNKHNTLQCLYLGTTCTCITLIVAFGKFDVLKTTIIFVSRLCSQVNMLF